MNIVLIGMRGVGKTNIARRICMPLKRAVMSTDVLVEYDYSMPIPQLVAQEGWRVFREAEFEVVRKLSVLDGIIIDAGGGVVVDVDSTGQEVYSRRKVDLLRSHGSIVFLKGNIDRLAAKVSGDATRPVLDDQRSAAELMHARLPFYEHAADWTIDVEGKQRADIAEEIVARYS